MSKACYCLFECAFIDRDRCRDLTSRKGRVSRSKAKRNGSHPPYWKAVERHLAKKIIFDKRLEPSKKQKAKRGKRRRLMAGANISDYRVRRILECYANRMTVADASAKLRISHVTVGRIFGLIRQRLVDIGIYGTVESHRNSLIDNENEGGRYYNEAEFKAPIIRYMGGKRGVSEENRSLYEAEALFKSQNSTWTGAQILLLLMQAIKDTGPLDRRPEMPISMSAMALSFHFDAAELANSARADARKAEQAGDHVSADNWKKIIGELDHIEDGFFDWRDQVNREFDPDIMALGHSPTPSADLSQVPVPQFDMSDNDRDVTETHNREDDLNEKGATEPEPQPVIPHETEFKS